MIDSLRLQRIQQVRFRMLVTIVALVHSDLLRPVTIVASHDESAVQQDSGWDNEAGDDAPAFENLSEIKRRASMERSIISTVFGRESEAQGIKRLHDMLVNEAISAQRVHDLDAESCRKLKLAGLGDIKRLLDKIEEIRNRKRPLNPIETRAFCKDLADLSRQMRLDVLFGEGSLYHKTLNRIVANATPVRTPER